MAVLHRAELRPSKLELLAAWLPTRRWYDEEPGQLELVAAYRFDDPAGEVGIETLLVRTPRGTVLQVPLTYRAGPQGDVGLVGSLEHSVLGTRWVHDGIHDPVYLTALATTILTGGHQAELLVEVDGEVVRREPTMHLRVDGAPEAPAPAAVRPDEIGDGDPATVAGGGLELVLARRVMVDGLRAQDGASMLRGSWQGQSEPVALAAVRAV